MRKIKEKIYSDNCFLACCGFILILLFYSQGVNIAGEISKYAVPCYLIALVMVGICQRIYRRNGSFSYKNEAESAFAPMALITSINFLVKIFLSYKAVVKFSVLFFSMPVITSVTCVLIYLTAKNIYSKKISMLCSALYALMPVTYVENFGDLKKPLASMVVVLALYLIFIGKSNTGICILSGLMLFASFVIDTTVLWIIPGVVIFEFYYIKGNFFKKLSGYFAFTIMCALYVGLLSLKNGELTGIVDFTININSDLSVFENIKNILLTFASNVKIFGFPDRRNIFISCYYCTYYLFILLSALLGTYISMKIVKRENVIFTTFVIFAIISCFFDYYVMYDKYMFAIFAVFLGGFSFEPSLEFVPMSIESQNKFNCAEDNEVDVELNRKFFVRIKKKHPGREGKIIFTMVKCPRPLEKRIKGELKKVKNKV